VRERETRQPVFGNTEYTYATSVATQDMYVILCLGIMCAVHVIYTFYALRTRTKYFRISNPSGADDSREVADEVRGGVRVRGGGHCQMFAPWAQRSEQLFVKWFFAV